MAAITSLPQVLVTRKATSPKKAPRSPKRATEESEEGTEEAGSEEAGDNCLTDPTTLTEEELAAIKHGSIVCWAAHQETWPEEFKNHGAWVSSWAHFGKDKDSAGATKAKGKGKDKSRP